MSGAVPARFELVDVPRLSRATVDREEPLRLDAGRLAAGWVKARVVVVDDKGRTPVRATDGGEYEVITKLGTDVAAAPPAHATLLGERDGVAYWAIRGRPSLVGADARSAGAALGADARSAGAALGADARSAGASLGADARSAGAALGADARSAGASLGADDPSRWQDLRARGADLDTTSAGLVVSAVAVLGWHDNARFCARDGSPTVPEHAGWLRRCEANGHEEYPRTDPAIICLVHDGGSGGSARVLLARQPVWPPGRYSVLAGFVEAGESLEACVAREIEEEVGVTVSDIRYLGSQAWPFPRSIMIGFSAVADPAQPLQLADGEIAEAFWVTRAELRHALHDGDWANGDWAAGAGAARQFLLPPPVSIARTMLNSWAAS